MLLASLLLTACAPETARELSVVVADEPSGITIWTPSAGSHGAPLEPVQGCASAAGVWEDTGGWEAIEPSWCVRLTPELEPEAIEGAGIPDTGSAGVGGPDGPSDGLGGAAPPCGFYNLVGAIAPSEDPEQPAALYCDSDADGGLRFVRYDPDGDAISVRLVDPGVCYADPQTGGFVELDDGYLLMWVDVDGFQVKAARLSLDGGVFEAPHPVAELPETRRLTLLRAGDGLLLALQDLDGGLHTAPVTRSGALAGPLTPLVEGIRTWSASAAGEAVLLVGCEQESHPDGDVSVHLLGGDGAAWSSRLGGASCGWAARPAAVIGDAGLAVTWDNGERGRVAFLDEAGLERRRRALDYDGLYPQAVGIGQEWLVVDASGAVHRMDADGDVLDRWDYPPLRRAAGTVSGLQLRVRGDQMSVTVLGYDAGPGLSPGHQLFFNYLEQSAAPVPWQ